VVERHRAEAGLSGGGRECRDGAPDSEAEHRYSGRGEWLAGSARGRVWEPSGIGGSGGLSHLSALRLGHFGERGVEFEVICEDQLVVQFGFRLQDGPLMKFLSAFFG
jgi:hypothetical protein